MTDAAGEQVFSRLGELGAVPVLSLDSVATALPLAEILLDERLPAIEVTFRTPAAAEIIGALRARFPALLVGAGTLLFEEQVRQAAAAGARFGVAPGLNERTLEAAQRQGLPFLPGVATPSEIERAVGYGLHTLKWFPAEALGGAAGLTQAAAPFLHLGLRFVPSGGISPSTLPAYLRLPAVLAAGGSWLAPQDELQRRDWLAVRARVRETKALVREARATAARAAGLSE